MKMLKVLSLFSGIGAFEKALEKLNIDYELVGFSEIDKYAIKSYCEIHGVSESLNLGDVSKIDTSTLPKDVDLLTHGSPCQDFSMAGKQAGGDKDSGTRSSLMYETIRIIGDIKPKYIIWENVKNLLSKKHIHNFNNYLKTLDELGYNSYYQVLNSKDYGIPQNRERVFTVSIRKDIDTYNLFQPFPFPEKQELKLRLKDILEDNVDEKYYLSEKMIKYISANNEKWTGNNNEALINKSVASTINTGEGCRRCDASNYISNDLPDNADLKVIRKYGIFDTEKSVHQARSVYDNNGLSPTLDTMQGGYRQPCIEVKEEAKIGLFDHAFSDNIPKVIIGSTQEHAAISTNGIVPTLTSAMGTGGGHVPMHNYDLRIRKLTPKECWRLMGFDDNDIDKCIAIGISNSQLYKQAGNSIVVNVLVEIFKELLKESVK